MAIPLIAASAAANIGGGLLGNLLSAGDRDKQMQQIQEIYARYANLNVPDTEKMRLALEEYQSVGNYNPDTEQAVQLAQNDDALQDVAIDPRLRQTQMQQLETLSKLGETGLSPIEAAELSQLRRQTDADNRSRIQAMLQDQDRRGVGSSDAALAARMMESQSAANRQSQEKQQIAADAFRRALEAKAAAGNLAGSMEQVSYSQQKDLADALNSRELYNTQQQSNVQQRNIDRFNQAQQSNLTNQQNIANQNTGLSNQQQQYNKELEQRKFENEMAKANAMSGAQQGVANAYGNRAGQTQQMWNQIGSGVGNAITAGGMNKMGAAAAPAAAKPAVQTTVDTDLIKKYGSLA